MVQAIDRFPISKILGDSFFGRYKGGRESERERPEVGSRRVVIGRSSPRTRE